MNDKQFNQLIQKLDTLIKLIAANLLRDKNKTEQIIILGNLGINRNEIATIVDTSPQVVSSRLSESRSKEKSKTEGVPSDTDKQRNP